MPLNDVILHIEGLRKSFGDVEVLKGINLELSRKEMLFLIGPRARARARSFVAATGWKSRLRA